jgi:hypothetical protein
MAEMPRRIYLLISLHTAIFDYAPVRELSDLSVET